MGTLNPIGEGSPVSATPDSGGAPAGGGGGEQGERQVVELGPRPGLEDRYTTGRQSEEPSPRQGQGRGREESGSHGELDGEGRRSTPPGRDYSEYTLGGDMDDVNGEQP
jgi:hypothetical protein